MAFVAEPSCGERLDTVVFSDVSHQDLVSIGNVRTYVKCRKKMNLSHAAQMQQHALVARAGFEVAGNRP